MLKRERSLVVPLASGEYMSSHTQLDGLDDGTKRSDGLKSIDVTPSFRRTSACTSNDFVMGEQVSSHVPRPYVLVAGSHTEPAGKTTA